MGYRTVGATDEEVASQCLRLDRGTLQRGDCVGTEDNLRPLRHVVGHVVATCCCDTCCLSRHALHAVTYSTLPMQHRRVDGCCHTSCCEWFRGVRRFESYFECRMVVPGVTTVVLMLLYIATCAGHHGHACRYTCGIVVWAYYFACLAGDTFVAYQCDTPSPDARGR